MQNLYEILGIDKKATKKQVRKAYLQKAKIHHPDKQGLQEMFNQISIAYQILMDDEKRKRYDSGETVDQILKANNNKAYSILSDILCKVLESSDPKTQDILEIVEKIINNNIVIIKTKILKATKEKENYEIFLKRVKKKKKGSFFMIDVAKAQVEVKKTLVNNLKKEETYFEEAKKINEKYDYEVDSEIASAWTTLNSFTGTTC